MPITDETLALTRQARSNLLSRSGQQIDDLTRQWQQAWKSVEAEWRNVAEEVAKAKGPLTPTQILRSKRATAALERTGRLTQEALRESGVSGIRDIDRVIRDANAFQAQAVASQVPTPERATFGASLNRVDDIQIHAMVKRTAEAMLSGWSGIPSQVQHTIRQQLVKGVAFGEHPETVARGIMANVGGAFDGGLGRAIRVARTEMLDAHRNAAGVWRKANEDVLAGWKWHTNLDTRTCPSCLSKNGTLYAVDDPGPLDHPNGRCDGVPVTKSWADLGFKNVSEPPSTFPDARAWYDSLPAAAQKAIMGPGRQALLADGKIGWDDLSGRVTTPGWRDSFTTPSLKSLQAKEEAYLTGEEAAKHLSKGGWDASTWAFQDYQEIGYQGINDALRAGKTPGTMTLPGMDTAFARTSTTTAPIQVSRGLRSDPFAGLKVGTKVTDPGFMSTSLSSTSSDMFAYGSANMFDAGGDRSVLMDIRIPKGYKAIPMNHAADLTADVMDIEAEVLLPRGTTLRLLGSETVDLVQPGTKKVLGQAVKYIFEVVI